MEGVGFFEIFSGALAWFYSLIPSYGLAIILLTVAVRVLLLPLSIKQTRSMREMQRIQPEVKKIQSRYKGKKDPAARQKMNEELMGLYKEHGVNPLGGCLPLLLQMPVFIALYRVLLTPTNYLKPFSEMALAVALRDPITAVKVNSFLGIHLNCTPSQIMRPGSLADNLTDVERALAEACGSGLMTALPYLVLVALMGYTTWYQQKQMQAKNTSDDPAAKQMQTMAKIMPIVLMFFAFTFPAGLTIYWLTTNLWTIVQQRIMLRAAPVLPPIGSDGTGKSAKATSRPDSGKPPGRDADRPDGQSPQTTKSKPHPSSKKKRKKR
jgi:YidC/Oxa1 family membrane protein insertase